MCWTISIQAGTLHGVPPYSKHPSLETSCVSFSGRTCFVLMRLLGAGEPRLVSEDDARPRRLSGDTLQWPA